MGTVQSYQLRVLPESLTCLDLPRVPKKSKPKPTRALVNCSGSDGVALAPLWNHGLQWTPRLRVASTLSGPIWAWGNSQPRRFPLSVVSSGDSTAEALPHGGHTKGLCQGSHLITWELWAAPESVLLPPPHSPFLPWNGPQEPAPSGWVTGGICLSTQLKEPSQEET